MVTVELTGDLYSLFAAILEYPTARIVEQAGNCATALAPVAKRAAGLAANFAEFCQSVTPGHLEELYTETFDLQAICSPYVGYHLFGEDRRRGEFMVRLKDYYRSQDRPLNGELPDHLSVMLKSVTWGERDGEAGELKGFCLVPAVKKMTGLFDGKNNPYHHILTALLITLEGDT